MQWWAKGHERPPEPCTYCNKCLLNAPKNPMGCYELPRFGGDRDRMIEELMSIYRTRGELRVPAPDGV